MDEDLRRRVEDAEVEGWSIYEEHGDRRVVMVKRKYGTLGGHVLVGLLTVWWTLGLGNAVYAAYKYFAHADKKVLRADD